MHINKKPQEAQKSPKIGKKLLFNCLNGGYTPPKKTIRNRILASQPYFFLFFKPYINTHQHWYKYKYKVICIDFNDV